MLLPRYILRAHVGPFLFSLGTLMFLFLLQFVMKFIDQLVGKGLSAWVIIELVLLSLAWMFVLAVPMSVLVAVLMAFGDLSARNEITAMKAGGISIYRMMAPVLVASAIVALLLVMFNNVILPESNHRLKALMVDIRRKKPTLALVNGVFSQDIPGYSILVRKTSERSNDLEGITLYDYSNASVNVAITAERGTISFSPDYRKLIFDLRDGEIHQLDLTQMHVYRRLRFTTHRLAMNVEGFDFERSSASAFARGDRELSAPAMLRVVDSLRGQLSLAEESVRSSMRRDLDDRIAGRRDSSLSAPGLPPPGQASMAALIHSRQVAGTIATNLFQVETLERQIDQYLVEIHKKYAIPTACLVFVLVGAPLGVMARRGGFGVAATLSLGFFVLYWACLIGGEKLADRDLVSPIVGMWIANVLIGGMGLWLTIRIGRETLLINWDAVTRFLPRRWRTGLSGTTTGDVP